MAYHPAPETELRRGLMTMLMQLIRWPIGQLILLGDALTSPKPPQRAAEDQAAIDRATEGYALYQFKACPFCVKTRRAMRRLGLNIELRDAANDPRWRELLLKGGGRIQVPCLYRPAGDGKGDWMYESSEIIDYLNQQFGDAGRVD